ncbi:MAG: hypothetical protein ABIV94_06025 [Acidimicrobiales bacterium]
MGERVAAVPSRLLELALATRGHHDELLRAAADLGAALAQARSRCPEGLGSLPDAGVELASAATVLGELSQDAHAVGTAFALAGAAGADGVVRTDAAAVEARLRTQWRPEGRVTRGDNAEWFASLYGTRCFAGNQRYFGATSFITGPDGRRYALVAPTVVRDGLAYNAEWGRDGSSSVFDLFGADPGWRTVDVESGVERHRHSPGAFERLMMGFGATATAPLAASSRGDVEAVVLEPGELPRIARVPAPSATTTPIPPDPEFESWQPLPVNLVALAPMAADFSLAVLNADDGAHDAYQISFQENADGRRRALYQRLDVIPGDDSSPTVLAPSYVVGPSLNDDDRILIRYLGPDGAVVREADPAYVVADPAPGLVPGDEG